MSLRQVAANDLNAIMDDTSGGFGWAITATPPAGIPTPLVGFTGDIAMAIDPQTGTVVSGRQAHVAIPLRAFAAAGLEIPHGSRDYTANPWVIEFVDTEGNSYVFAVRESMPDRALGVVVLILEAYKV